MSSSVVSPRLAASLLAVLVLGAGLSAVAGPSKVWRITTYKDFEEGESEGVLLSSLGEASVGFAATRVDVPAAQIFSSATGPDGTVFFGSGDQADVLAWDGKAMKKLAHLEGVLVSALAVAPDGTLYAGTLPGGKLWQIGRGGDKKELAKLDGADQVWALLVDAPKHTLYAATGPAGKLFAVDLGSGKARVLWDSGERHLLSLARDKDGGVLVGSADEAILYRVGENGTARAVHDFAGDELRAVVRSGDSIFVAVNEFERPKSSTGTTPTTPITPKALGTKMVLPTTAATGSTGQPPGRERKGKGAVYRIDGDGRVEQLHALADGYFTALAVDRDGNVYAAAGANGRVYLIRTDRSGEEAARGPTPAAGTGAHPADVDKGAPSTATVLASAARPVVLTAFNLPERQVLTLALDGPHPALGTGDAGAVYAVEFAPPKAPRYFSKILDAGTLARWGTVRWSSEGAVTVETRSGNTARPDRTWSEFQGLQRGSATAGGGEGKVASAAGRYVQLRATLGKAARLRDASIYYQPQNLRPRVTELTIGEDAAARIARPVRTPGKPRSPVVKIRWKVESPDEDELLYRLYYREAASEAGWRTIGGADPSSGGSGVAIAAPLAAKEYEWNTEGLADGSYVVKVVASDERSNPRGEALAHELASPPLLVDNRKPDVVDVKIDYPSASGLARDAASPITEIAYAIDGGDWILVGAKDGVLDDPVEEFALRLPDGLAAGGHTLAVRATDSADNAGIAQSSFRVKR